MITVLAKHVKEYFYPKSIAQQAREEKLRLMTVARQTRTELIALRREISGVEACLRAASRAGNSQLIDSLSRTLAGLRDVETRKIETENNIMLLRYQTTEVSDMSSTQGVVSGLNSLVVKQNKRMNPTKLVAQQKAVANNMQELRKGADALNDTLRCATGVSSAAGSKAEEISNEAYQMQADKTRLEMPNTRTLNVEPVLVPTDKEIATRLNGL